MLIKSVLTLQIFIIRGHKGLAFSFGVAIARLQLPGIASDVQSNLIKMLEYGAPLNPEAMGPNKDYLHEGRLLRVPITDWAVRVSDTLLEKRHSSANEGSHTPLTAQRGNSERCAGRLLAEHLCRQRHRHVPYPERRPQRQHEPEQRRVRPRAGQSLRPAQPQQ